MRYARVGTSGLEVSRLVLGMMSFGDHSQRAWHLDLDAARPLVRRAAEAGITAYDTADVYDRGVSEEVTGDLLREVFSRREDYVLSTKVYYPMSDAPGDRGLSRRHILASIDASLRRLGTDHVDLYYVHRWDHETPIEETMEALDAVVRAGKARYLGASSMYAWQFAKAQHVAEQNGWHRFVAMQNHYHLAYREEEREMVPLCLDQGVGVLPYSPLARGLLTGSRTRGGGGSTTRSGNDPAAGRALLRCGLRRGGRARRGRRRPRSAPRAGRAGLAAGPDRSDRAGRRRHQGRPSRGRPGRSSTSSWGAGSPRASRRRTSRTPSPGRSETGPDQRRRCSPKAIGSRVKRYVAQFSLLTVPSASRVTRRISPRSRPETSR